MLPKQTKNKWLKFLRGLRDWWKRRFSCSFQHDPLDEESLLEEQLGLRNFALLDCQSHANDNGVREVAQGSRKRPLLSRSFSVESMDSLDYSEYEEDIQTKGEASTIARLFRQNVFFLEHLNFLTAATQPREVEVVYNI